MQGAGRNPSCGARAGQAPHLSPVAAGVQLETRQLLPGSRSSSHITAATPPSCLAWWHGVFRLPSGEPPGSSVHLSLKVPPRWGCLLTSFLGFHGDREASTPPPWELTLDHPVSLWADGWVLGWETPRPGPITRFLPGVR